MNFETNFLSITITRAIPIGGIFSELLSLNNNLLHKNGSVQLMVKERMSRTPSESGLPRQKQYVIFYYISNIPVISYSITFNIISSYFPFPVQ